MKIKSLSITFHTDKLKECIDFYKRHFQAKVSFDDGEWYVVIRLESDSDTSPLYLSFQGDSDYYERVHFRGGVSLNLETANLDACYEELKQTEIAFTEDITDHEWGDRAFSVKDPIGNVLYIYSERPLHEKYKDAVKE